MTNISFNLANSVPNLQQLPSLTEVTLSGEAGSNREPQARCQIRAHNDYEAIQCWLQEYQHKKSTHRTYQKEAERFLLWCIYQHDKALSSLDRDDLEAYIAFLADPQPSEKWCGPKSGRGVKRGAAGWRPFTGPLGDAAKRTAVSSIDSLLSYLVQARYLSFNPLVLIKKKYQNKHARVLTELNLHERMLSQDEWQAMLKTMHAMPEATNKERDEKARVIFLVSILFLLGLRIDELARHAWNAFRKVDDLWWFYVVGKGDKPARIPVNNALLKAVIKYRSQLGKAPLPASSEATPIIKSFTTHQAITPRQMNKILKTLALGTAAHFKSDIGKCNKLKKFSAHWLRHMSASMQDRAGVQFKHIRANHRHENDETTRKYVHAIDHERHEEMQRLTL